MNVVDTARQFLFVREVSQNRGRQVEAIQRWANGQPGDSWCCEFVTMVLDISFCGKSPFPPLRAVEDVYNLAKKNNWMTITPSEGDLFIYVDSNNHAHHVGIYTGNNNGIAGNTSQDGMSSNGTGVFEHSLNMSPTHTLFIRYPR